MDSSLMMVLVLSFISVSTEQQKEPVESLPFPDTPPALQRADNDVSSQPTDTPSSRLPFDLVDGNHPDNQQITTHDHVDQITGHVPPTKRVKKILPPFEGLRTARHIEESPEELKLPRAPGGGQDSVPRETTESSWEEPESSLRGGEEIEGIRLVPEEGERGEEGEGEGEGEGLSMQKSIWDLLRERERFNTESSHLDAVESSGNESETTSREPRKSLYENFDADSAEVELEMRNLKGGNVEKHEVPGSLEVGWGAGEGVGEDVSRLVELSENEEDVRAVRGGVGSGVGGSGEGVGEGRRGSRWYLLLLRGNGTIVEIRRKDFAKYLKLNLAARLSLEYDDVKVNKVILAPPKVVVNISVFAPSDDVAEESELDLKVSDKGEALLYKLAETNATLLELSGEEYRVIRFLSFESQRPEAEAHKDVTSTVALASRQSDLEFILYTFLGSACACGLLLTFFVTLNRYYKKVSDFSWLKPKQMAWREHQDIDTDKDEFTDVSPAVIYSGGFPQIRGSWMTGPQPAPPFRRQCPTSPPPRPPASYPDIDHRPCASPRHSRLHIYNCDANTLVIPAPARSRLSGRLSATDRRDSHPLDPSLSGEEAGQDNPIFTN